MKGKSGVAVKLLANWDIKPGQEMAFFNFVIQEFAPTMMRIGLRPTETWYTVYGDAPQILASAEANDLETMHRILGGNEWEELKSKLLNYVTNFRLTVVPSTGRFQIF